MDTEVPMRVYTQTSRQYLQKLYPQMAQYVGGTIENSKTDDASPEIGLLEF